MASYNIVGKRKMRNRAITGKLIIKIGFTNLLIYFLFKLYIDIGDRCKYNEIKV